MKGKEKNVPPLGKAGRKAWVSSQQRPATGKNGEERRAGQPVRVEGKNQKASAHWPAACFHQRTEKQPARQEANGRSVSAGPPASRALGQTENPAENTPNF